MEKEKTYLKEEIRREFQLERMVLFSDAVFAIVITLMAIEIHVPHNSGKLTETLLLEELKQLLPVFFAYLVSFFFIGQAWYRHLKFFSLLKDYDKGLLIRNLVMLFFIGLFPFGASLVSQSGGLITPIYIYFGIIFSCTTAQYTLNYYIVYQQPKLCRLTDTTQEKESLQKSKFVLVALMAIIILIFVTDKLITNPDLKPLSSLWALLLLGVRRISKKKNKAEKASPESINGAV